MGQFHEISLEGFGTNSPENLGTQICRKCHEAIEFMVGLGAEVLEREGRLMRSMRLCSS